MKKVLALVAFALLTGCVGFGSNYRMIYTDDRGSWNSVSCSGNTYIHYDHSAGNLTYRCGQ